MGITTNRRETRTPTAFLSYEPQAAIGLNRAKPKTNLNHETPLRLLGGGMYFTQADRAKGMYFTQAREPVEDRAMYFTQDSSAGGAAYQLGIGGGMYFTQVSGGVQHPCYVLHAS